MGNKKVLNAYRAICVQTSSWLI